MTDPQFTNQWPYEPSPQQHPGDPHGSATIQMPVSDPGNGPGFAQQPTDEPPFLQEPSWQQQPRNTLPQVVNRSAEFMDRWPAIAGLGFAVLMVLTIAAVFMARPGDSDASAALAPPAVAPAVNQTPERAPVPPAPAPETTVAPTTTTTEPTTTTTAPTTTVDPFAGYPTAVADTGKVSWGRGKFDVLANDDPGAGSFDLKSLEIVTPPEHARSVKVSDGQIRYRSEWFYDGEDFLEYMICNNLGDCSIAGVSISVGF